MGDNQAGSKESERGTASRRSPSLADDMLYRALADRKRRRLLFSLLDSRESSVEELAKILTGWSTTERGRMATPEEYRNTRVELVHSHLEILADAGFVEYDRESGHVRLESLPPLLQKLIRESVDADSPNPS